MLPQPVSTTRPAVTPADSQRTRLPLVPQRNPLTIGPHARACGQSAPDCR